MRETACRGVVRGNTVVLDQPGAFADGAEVMVQPVNGVRSGSPRGILNVLRTLPRVDPETAEELLRKIEEARMPVRYRNPLVGPKRFARRSRRKPARTK